MTQDNTSLHNLDADIEAVEAAEIQALLPVAAAFFKLGSIHKVKPTPFGIGNESFIVSTENGEFILRILWEQTIAGLEKEVAVERQLISAGILSVQLIQGENGNYYFTDGKYTITVSKKIEGNHPQELDTELLNDLGGVVAAFHTAVTSVPSETSQWLNPDRALIELSKVTDKELRPIIEKNIKDGLLIFKKPLPTGFIHGDIYAGNLIITPENHLALLDLETTGRNIFIVDIARTILDVCADGTSINKASVEALLHGYEKVRSLTDDEKECMAHAILYTSGAMAAWLLAERNQTNVARELLQRATSY
jgi:Ser/Thr protein kinase RdoA (MazF antagonist)